MADEDLEKKVKKLKDAIDETTEVGFGWEQVSKEALKASPEYLKLYKGKDKITDENYEDALNKRAQTYLKGLGIKAGKQGPEFYGHMIKSWISSMGQQEGGRLMSELEESIKRGDELAAAHVMQQAYQHTVTDSKTSLALQNVENAKSDVKIKLYKDWAKDVGGEDGDYLEVAKSIKQTYHELSNKRQRTYRFQKEHIYKKAA